MKLTNRISFLSADDRRFLDDSLRLGEDAAREIREITDYYGSLDADFAFSLTDGCLAVRVYDSGSYSFVFPYEIDSSADLSLAVQKIIRYASLEELMPVFVNVPCEELSLFFELGCRHIDLDADSPDASTYRVTLKNECMLLCEIPELREGSISLAPLTEADVSEYARLACDSENNKYWGYDYREDYGEVSDDFLLTLAERELQSGSALTLAVRSDGIFVGEAVLHAFDFRGGADVSVRILPEHQNKGYGTAALRLLLDVAAELSLTALYARVNPENLPSLALFSKFADEKDETDGYVVFVYSLVS